MKKIIGIILISLGFLFIAGCSGENEENIMLYLKFDEKNGNLAADSTKNLPAAKVQYILSDGMYQDSVDPQWRKSGVKGGALQFDGYSTFIQYDYEKIAVEGTYLTVELWIMPRAFEWLPYDGDKLTAFVSQHSKDSNAGFVFGMARHGAWSFQAGIGDRWVEVWDDGNFLEKYIWTHIAVTFDGDAGELKIYKNGELINTEVIYEGASIRPAVNTPLTIGKNSESDKVGVFSKQMFSGLMDELKILDRTLNEEEIKNEYKKLFVKGKIKETVFEDVWFDEKILINDINKPLYHISAVQHWMNEPHAPMYYNGKYHLFYQFNPFGPYWQQIHWGHWVSDDMVVWRNVKEAISPEANSVAPDGIWSGGAAYMADGTPVLMFTAGDDSRRLNRISNQNIGIAYPKDLTDPNLTEWVMGENLIVAQKPGQGVAGEFRDSHIWKENDTWYMVIAASSSKYRSGDVLIYTTKDGDLQNWEYKGSVYEWNAPVETFGTSWELPVLLPIKYADGSFSGKYYYSISPAPAGRADNSVFYWIGDFDKETCRFTPDHEEPKLIDFGSNVFTGPSAFIDPVSGHIVMFSIIQDQRTGTDAYNSGWAHNAGLARVLWVNEKHELMVGVTPNIENIAGKVLYSAKNITVEDANKQLADVKGDTIRVNITVKNKSASKFGVYVRQTEDKKERTLIYYDARKEKLGINTETASLKQNIKGNFSGDFTVDNDLLKMEIYIDRSIIEGFFNNKKTVTARVYPTLKNADGIELFMEGGAVEIIEMTVQEMNSIYGGR